MRLEVPMAGQEQSKRQQPADEVKESEVADSEVAASEVTEGIDDLLDEIDSVLEENAEEFVKNYVQKGGQ